MAKREQLVSDNKVPSTSDLIPVDVVINILSRLPLKSIAKSRCVSKLWSSISRRPYFNQLFPTKSLSTPRLFFVFNTEGKLFFYSAPQTQNPDDNSSLLATRHDMDLGTDCHQLCRPVHGLVCSQHNGYNCSWAVISNPITGEYVTTPKVTIEGIHLEWSRGKASYSFGYDPIDQQFKVLRITWFSRSSYVKYHVLTLGTGDENLTWREIQCCARHYPLDDSGICENGICIKGVLYYPAVINNKIDIVVCFDVRSERFSFISIDEDLALHIHTFGVLINYKGKIGISYYDFTHKHFELMVLEDAKERKWSMHIYKVSHPRLNVATYVRSAGIIDSGEMVLYPNYPHSPFCIYYVENNTTRRVTLEVPVGEKFNSSSYGRAYSFANYVEELTLM